MGDQQGTYPRVRVRLLKMCVQDNQGFGAGTILEVPKNRADYWIRSGRAEPAPKMEPTLRTEPMKRGPGRPRKTSSI